LPFKAGWKFKIVINGSKALKLNLIRHCSVRAKFFFYNFFGGNFYLTYLIKLLSNHFFYQPLLRIDGKKEKFETLCLPVFL